MDGGNEKHLPMMVRSPMRSPTVSGGWLTEPEPEPELTYSYPPLLRLRHAFFRHCCSRLAAMVRTDGDAVDRLLTNADSEMAVEAFFTDPLCSRLYVWLPAQDTGEDVPAAESVTVFQAAAAAQHARATGLCVGSDPPGMYIAAVCLFKPTGEPVTEENVTRAVSTIELGGSLKHAVAQVHGQQPAGIGATLGQVSLLSRHLYFPVGAEQLCPEKELGPAEEEPIGAAGTGEGGGKQKVEAWSDGWNITAMDSQVGEAAKRQVAADFSRFVADLDVAAVHATASHEVCLPVPLSEEIAERGVEARSLGDRVRMIERAVGSWTNQCRSILDDESTPAEAVGAHGESLMVLPGPRVELEHWSVRRHRLDSVTNQLSERQVEVCMQVLRAVQSTVYPEFARCVRRL